MAYEPEQYSNGTTNAAGEHTYRVRITFGSGAIASYRSKDLVPTRNSAGQYKLTLPKQYNEITHFAGAFFRADGQTTLVPQLVTISDLSVGGTLTLETVTPTGGTATDPATGDVLYLTVSVSTDLLNNQFKG